MPSSTSASSDSSSGEWLIPPFKLRTKSIAVGTPAEASTPASCPAPEASSTTGNASRSTSCRSAAVGSSAIATAALAIAGVAVAIRPACGSAGGSVSGSDSFARVNSIVEQRCVPCHSAHPTKVAVAPKGVMFDTPAQIVAQASAIQQVAVTTKVMPIGNATGMTQGERDLLGAWIRQGAKIK